MNQLSWREKMMRFNKNAEVIFDAEEPVGKPTDLVMPDRRWFGRRPARQTSAQLKSVSK